MASKLEPKAAPASVSTAPQLIPLASGLSRRKRFRFTEESRAGLVFILPFLIGFVVFTVGPLLASLYLSFTSYDVLNPPVWIGLDNYKQMMADERFSKTLYNTLYFVVLHVPTAIPIALGLAVMLNAKVRGLS